MGAVHACGQGSSKLGEEPAWGAASGAATRCVCARVGRARVEAARGSACRGVRRSGERGRRRSRERGRRGGELFCSARGRREGRKERWREKMKMKK